MLDRQRLIVLNDTAAFSGGAAQIAIMTARLAAQNGWETRFVVGDARPPDPQLAAAGVKVQQFGFNRLLETGSRLAAARRGLWNGEAGRWVAGMIAEAGPNCLFHLHMWTQTLSPSVLAALAPVAERTLVTLHDYSAACPNGGFFDYRLGLPCPLEPLSRACVMRDCDKRSYAQKLWRVGRQLAQRGPAGFPGKFRHFICVSPGQAARLRPSLPQDARLVTVHNPVARLREDRVKAETNTDVVWIGRISEEKGWRLFAGAVRKGGLASHVRVAGDGPDAAEMQALLPEARFEGWLSADRVSDLLGTARILVFPSIWEETYGLSAAQAAACGVPVLISDRCGAADDIQRLQGDGVFPGGDEAALVGLIARWWQDDAGIRARSKRAWAGWQASPLDEAGYWDALEAEYRLAGGRERVSP
ncbi:glycosyltransferase [Oceanicaulis alexandrii]|uniref:glycosyltransferase n=1 Tax=Oceanicaulis alexandrii TaxID=153233 RepID=UPI002352F05F|nr:glycosyltransferase [Oceanicaulis alexandrii]